jgi:chitinase
MIGQNDIQGERFTVTDAQGLLSFASHAHLGRVSLWSLNRDTPVPPALPVPHPRRAHRLTPGPV